MSIKRREVDMDKIDLNDAIKIETIVDTVPDKYYLFRSGGEHYFSQLSEHMDGGIYEEKIWPWVLNISTRFNREVLYTTALGTLGGKGYPTIRLNKLDQTGNNNTNNKRLLQYWNSLHKLVALAYVPNPDPEKNLIVHHKNDNKFDYRPENLEWTTTKKNSSKGSKGNKINVDELYLHYSGKEWFKK
jgi:hypothetical protein